MSIYRRPKFLEILHEVREEMSREADYDVDLFAEMVRSGKKIRENRKFEIANDEAKNKNLSANRRQTLRLTEN